jgi:hypothetical protein
MNYLLLLPLLLFACSDWPTKDSQENESNPIEINIEIENSLNDPSDNDSMEVDVDSNSDSQSDSSSDSSSESTIDNSTGLIYYNFQMIN